MIVKTERLLLREFEEGDVPFVLELLNSKGWLQYIGDRGVRTHKQAIAYIAQGPVKSYATHGYGLWVATLTTDHTPVGVCGLLKRDNLPYPDIGFAFLPQFQGMGYAFECCRATLEFVAEKYQVTKVCAINTDTNKPCSNLLAKLGFSRKGTLPPDHSGEALTIYGNY